MRATQTREPRNTGNAIKGEDIVESVRGALQYISYYHPKDYLQHLSAAYDREQSPSAKNAIAQILVNSRMAALGKRPICQDTGLVVAFAKVGQNARIVSDRPLADLINDGVRQAYLDDENPLRASMVFDPIFARKNTRDNTPAIVHVEMVLGDCLEITVAAKGGGSENKAKFAVLDPSASVVDWAVETVKTMGAGWCPPGLIALGVGGSAEKAMLLAKVALMEPIDTLTREQMASWKIGETLLLSGHMLTGRDAAHARMAALAERGEPLPVELSGRVIYYVGPVDPVGDEVVGPAGPTTSIRMDRYTDLVLGRGLLAMVGKAERGPAAIASIASHGATYLITVGGAAYLVSKAIKQSKVLAFGDLGMEAIYEFVVEDMPVVVAVDSKGSSIHTVGPANWFGRHATRSAIE